MDKMKLEEVKSFTTEELLLEQINYQYPLDSLIFEFPEDIENWNKAWQFDDFRNQMSYQFWVKYVEVDNDNFVVNGYFQKFKNSDI